MTLKRLKKAKDFNDKNKNNTYLIRRHSDRDSWIEDELCIVRVVNEDCFKLFRSFDGKVYTLPEEELENFILIGVII